MSDAATNPIALRPMLPADVPVLAAIYQAAVDELAAEDYDEGQRAAWAATADDEEAFGSRLLAALTLVATISGAPVGFVSLEGTHALKMLYVYPRATRRGVATQLLHAVERLAGGRGSKLLEVDASDTALPFFEARGFTAQLRQSVSLGEQWLGSTRMTKKLP